MEWGPSAASVQLAPGDEVPLPFNKNRIPMFIAEVDEISGKKWADQPAEVQDAWALLNSLPPVIHPSQLVGVEEFSPPEAPTPQEVAAADVVAAPPQAPKKRGRPKGSKTTKRVSKPRK